MPSHIAAGQLRQRITITDPTVVTAQQDSFGQIIPGPDPPTVYPNIPAAIEFTAAKLIYSAQTFTSQVTHKITIRWMPGIKAQQEVTFTDAEGRTRQLQIQFIDNPDERNHVLILSCLERNIAPRVDVIEPN